MDKPISLIRNELIENLASVINNSGLSPCVIEPILESLLNETRFTMQKQYEVEKKQYEQYLKDCEKNDINK